MANSLTKEQKLKMLDALQERKRRALSAKSSYVPHEGQRRIHASEKQERWVLCGNAFGKTTALVNEVHWAATGFNPITGQTTKVPAKIVVILDSPEKVKDQYLYEYKKWYPVDEKHLHKDAKPYYRRQTYDNGSEVTFMFHDQEEMKFEGISDIHWIFSDEPMPRYIYIALYRGTRELGSQPRLLMCGTAINQGWIRREIWQPWSRGELKNVECFQFESEMNRANLRTGFLEDFAAKLTEAERRVRLSGAFFDAEGLALAELLDPTLHKIPKFDVDPSWPCLIIIDPHPRKAHTAILITCSGDDDVYVIDELASRKIPSDFARYLYDRWGEYNVVDIVSDSLGSSELTGGSGNLSFIQVLNQTWQEECDADICWRVRPTSYQEKQDEAWIQVIQEVLQVPLEPDNFGNRFPKLRIFEHCRGLWFDLQNVAWYKTKHSEELKPKLDMTQRDYLSCLKYGLAARPTRLRHRGRVIQSRRSPWSGAPNSHSKPYKEDEDDNFDSF